MDSFDELLEHILIDIELDLNNELDSKQEKIGFSKEDSLFPTNLKQRESDRSPHNRDAIDVGGREV